MPSVSELLPKYFTFKAGLDHLPILGVPSTGRERGRHQLAAMMNELGFRTGIEVGTAHRVSAKIWCKAIPGLDLTCIDPYIAGSTRTQQRHDTRYKNAQVHAKTYGFKLLRMTSMEAVDDFEDGSVDFVHIDGDHRFDAVVQDIVRYVPKVRKGGLVLLHDYHVFKLGGVMKAVDAYTHCHRIDPWYVTRDYEPTVFWERGSERA